MSEEYAQWVPYHLRYRDRPGTGKKDAASEKRSAVREKRRTVREKRRTVREKRRTAREKSPAAARGWRRWVLLSGCLMIVAACLLLLFPVLQRLLDHQEQTEVIEAYRSGIESFSSVQLATMWEEAEKYNEELFRQVSGQPNPFTMSLTELNQEYDRLLNPGGDGILCYLEIPQIGLALSVYHGTEEEELEKGAGHMRNSSLPVGGSNTHTVVAAHTGLPNAEMFDRLYELEKGSRFVLSTLDRQLEYTVDAVRVIEPDDTEPLQIRAGEDRVTLLTCYPYGMNTHRLLVSGLRRKGEENQNDE